jgi:hypothetical protein
LISKFKIKIQDLRRNGKLKGPIVAAGRIILPNKLLDNPSDAGLSCKKQSWSVAKRMNAIHAMIWSKRKGAVLRRRRACSPIALNRF